MYLVVLEIGNLRFQLQAYLVCKYDFDNLGKEVLVQGESQEELVVALDYSQKSEDHWEDNEGRGSFVGDHILAGKASAEGVYNFALAATKYQDDIHWVKNLLEARIVDDILAVYLTPVAHNLSVLHFQSYPNSVQLDMLQC